MFTEEDQYFLECLDARADARLADADDCADRLRTAIDFIRSAVVGGSVLDEPARREVDDLLDLVWWAAVSGDRERARAHAVRLGHFVSGQRMAGLQGMRVADVALQIRTLTAMGV